MCNGTVGISTFLFFLIFNEYTAIWYLTCIFVVECPSPKNCDSTLPLCDPWLTLISYAWPLTDLCFLCVTPTWMFDPLSLHECISMTPSIICDATDLGPLCITLDWLFVTPSPPPSTSASYVWPPLTCISDLWLTLASSSWAFWALILICSCLLSSALAIFFCMVPFLCWSSSSFHARTSST